MEQEGPGWLSRQGWEEEEGGLEANDMLNVVLDGLNAAKQKVVGRGPRPVMVLGIDANTTADPSSGVGYGCQYDCRSQLAAHTWAFPCSTSEVPQRFASDLLSRILGECWAEGGQHPCAF